MVVFIFDSAPFCNRSAQVSGFGCQVSATEVDPLGQHRS
ncbi:hypothetical protein D1AOALGA4SA_3533 [Olavius algarvensis Delta 1 endosymbiont]|nr:hypothetical protein D1AOALGA4SA_3533 [Olavius algarvensis Delta 1 endosymbiont]